MGDAPPPTRSSSSPQVKLGVLSRRPTFAAATALILGILLHRAFPDRPQLCLALSMTAAAASIIGLRFGILSTASLVASLASLGVAVAQLEHLHFAADHVIAYTTETPRLAEVELLIDQAPRVLSMNAPSGRPLPPRQVTAGVVRRVKTWGGWRDASGRILLQLSPPVSELQYDQRIAVLGILSRPAPAMNPGQFDWANYYREQRTLVAIDAPHPQNIRILAAPGF